MAIKKSVKSKAKTKVPAKSAKAALKDTTSMTPAAKQLYSLVNSVIATGNAEAIDYFTDFVGVASTLVASLVEAQAGSAPKSKKAKAEVEEDDEEEDENFDEDESDEDDDEIEEDEDESDEEEDFEEDEDGESEEDESDEEEDEDFEEDESDEEEDEDFEEDESEDEDDEESEEDEDDEESDEDEDDGNPYADLSLPKLKKELADNGVDWKTVLGKADPKDADEVREQLLNVLNDALQIADELDGKSLKALEKIAAAEEIEISYGRTRKEEAKLEIALTAVALGRAAAAHATVKPKAKPTAKTAKPAAGKKRSLAKKTRR